MANQEQNPPQQEQPFVAAKQVGFNLKDILLNTNNEVSLLYPKDNNKDHFKCVSDFISKCCLRKPFTRSPNMYKEYLAEFWYSARSLENSKVFFSILTGSGFQHLGMGKRFQQKELSERVSFLLVAFKAPKPSSNVKRVPQGTKPGAKPGHKKHSSSKQLFAMDSNPSHPPFSTPMDTGMHKEDQQATGGLTSLRVTSEERANPQLSSGTDPHVLADQTKSVSEGLETVLTQPITGKGASSIARQVEEEEASSTIKLEDLAKLVSNVEPNFKDLDSPEDDLVIVVDDSDEDKEDEVHPTPNAETDDTSSQKHKLELEKNKGEAESALLKAQTSFPNVKQLNELLVKSLKSEFSEILSTHDFSSSLPTKLKDLPSKFNDLTKELEDFTKTITSLTSQVAKLKTLQWELPVEFLVVPSQVEMVQANLKTLDALPSLLNNVTNALNQFAQAITSKKTGSDSEDKGKKALSSEDAKKESTDSNSDDETHVTGSMVEPSRTKKLKKFDFITKDGRHIHLTEEEINHQKKLEEDAKAEAAKQEREVRKADLVDLLGLEVVKKYYNDKLQYDKYCDKILNRRAISRITNCDVLTRKGPTTLKVYREDGTSEIIPNFKASYLHLGEWREVMKACPNRAGKGWETIYKQIGTRMDYIYTTKAKLGINLDIPLSQQDPLDKLNNLVNKKRKHADDIHDYFKANKRLKSSVQYKDHLPGTVLNEPVLCIGFPPYSFNYPTRRMTIEEMLDKFIVEGKREQEEMEIFIKEFRTSNELLLKERSNLLIKGVITRGGKMTSEAIRSKEINENGINKNKPPRFEQDVQEKPNDDGVESKSSALVQITKYAKYLKNLFTNKSNLEEACAETTNERCSAVLLNELPSKEKDPRSFTIPCQVLEIHKDAKDLAADHLSSIDNPHMEVVTEREIADKFFDKQLMVLKSKFKDDEPWYADFVNYIVGKVVPLN
ncbi:hypothetical protein Tco_0409213 [Tanacetum coccineum]